MKMQRSLNKKKMRSPAAIVLLGLLAFLLFIIGLAVYSPSSAERVLTHQRSVVGEKDDDAHDLVEWLFDTDLTEAKQ